MLLKLFGFMRKVVNATWRQLLPQRQTPAACAAVNNYGQKYLSQQKSIQENDENAIS